MATHAAAAATVPSCWPLEGPADIPAAVHTQCWVPLEGGIASRPQRLVVSTKTPGRAGCSAAWRTGWRPACSSAPRAWWPTCRCTAACRRGAACRTSCFRCVPHTRAFLCPCRQTDVGGLLYELDTRLGTSFHEAVVAQLPAIRSAAAAAAASASRSRPSGTASGHQLLQAAQQRTALLQRAYDTISGLQQDVDACLAELGGGSAAGRATSPLPFPPLGTPGGAAQAGSECQPARMGATAPQEQLQQVGSSHEQPTDDQQHRLQQQGLGQAPGLPATQEPPMQQGDLANPSDIPAGSLAGSGTPPAQRLAPTASLPTVLSPGTAAFVGAAFSCRDTEAAEHAAQTRAVLNTSLRDATVEAGR